MYTHGAGFDGTKWLNCFPSAEESRRKSEANGIAIRDTWNFRRSPTPRCTHRKYLLGLSGYQMQDPYCSTLNNASNCAKCLRPWLLWIDRNPILCQTLARSISGKFLAYSLYSTARFRNAKNKIHYLRPWSTQ